MNQTTTIEVEDYGKVVFDNVPQSLIFSEGHHSLPVFYQGQLKILLNILNRDPENPCQFSSNCSGTSSDLSLSQIMQNVDNHCKSNTLLVSNDVIPIRQKCDQISGKGAENY